MFIAAAVALFSAAAALGAESSSSFAADHWAFRPVARPGVPQVKRTDWVRNPVDAFVLARLEREGMEPSPEADRRTLVRRLHLDLVGLPPSPQEVESFVTDQSPDSYEKVVDRLLASPHFGERWGRHWLDLARYADSDGYENDKPRPHAWRYRDWVIDAINRDVPYDQFTVEQLAGDLLPGATVEQKVATGFHRNTLHNSASGADVEEFRTKAIKDRANTTGTVWLGLTVACAQCHTHKYDPISHREYYSLYAFFNETGNDNMNHPAGGEAPVIKAEARETAVHLRGDFLQPGSKVEPATPAFLPPLRPRGARPDRLDLARWIAAADHPLTARVAVNHVWQHLFGKPLVPTPENFGTNGEKPTHPELLDWLASEFARPTESPGPGPAWSRKRLIRLILTSAVYRQASAHRPGLAERDPGNSLLARQNRFRVEAEVVRDLPLSVAGLLDLRTGGPSVQPPLPTGLSKLAELKNETFVETSANRADRYRRGVYVNVQRTFPYPTLQAFDVTDGNETCPRRDRSNTPMQALTLLNDPVFFECAQTLGRRLIREAPGADDAARIRHGWQLCLGRPPGEEELATMRELLEHHREVFGKDEPAAKAMIGEAAVPEGAGAVEVASWIGVARTLLNVEEFYARE